MGVCFLQITTAKAPRKEVINIKNYFFFTELFYTFTMKIKFKTLVRLCKMIYNIKAWENIS